jgi:hypothetical protein
MGIAQYIDYHIEKTMLWIQGNKKIRRLEGLLMDGCNKFYYVDTSRGI